MAKPNGRPNARKAPDEALSGPASDSPAQQAPAPASPPEPQIFGLPANLADMLPLARELVREEITAMLNPEVARLNARITEEFAGLKAALGLTAVAPKDGGEDPTSEDAPQDAREGEIVKRRNGHKPTGITGLLDMLAEIEPHLDALAPWLKRLGLGAETPRPSKGQSALAGIRLARAEAGIGPMPDVDFGGLDEDAFVQGLNLGVATVKSERRR